MAGNRLLFMTESKEVCLRWVLVLNWLMSEIQPTISSIELK